VFEAGVSLLCSLASRLLATLQAGRALCVLLFVQRSSKKVLELTKKLVEQKAFFVSRAGKLALPASAVCLDVTVDDPATLVDGADAQVDSAKHSLSNANTENAETVAALTAEVTALKAQLGQKASEEGAKVCTCAQLCWRTPQN
jgi:hypothetical protein